MRISLLGKKIGMTQIINGSNTLPVTLLEIVDHDVFGLKTLEKDGYNAIIFSAGDIKKEKNTAKPLLVQFKKLDLQPKERLFEVRVESQTTLKSFEKINNDILDGLEERFIDVSGVTIGKGFAGPMKRWNFAGLEASHGVSVSHRSHGSTGQRQDPGRVFKGKKMAGHLGHTNNTVQNLQIVSVDKDLKVIAVHGAIPGHKNSYVFVNDSVKMGRLQSFTKVNNINLIF